jgi:uncharacterized protein YeaO (DUF488 family)
MHELQLKRVYEPWSTSDGTRILVDRLWPRAARDPIHNHAQVLYDVLKANM